MQSSVDRTLQRAMELLHGNWLHAVHLLQESALDFPQEPRLQYALGDIFFQKQRYDKAVKFYLVALSLDPANQDLPVMIANCYLARYDYRLALAYYNRIVNPSDEALYNKALTLAFLGQSQECVEILEAILPRCADHPLIYYLLVEQNYLISDFQKALKYAAIADQKNGKHVQLYLMTAIIYHEIGNMFQAYSSFKKADELNRLRKSEHLMAYARAALGTGLWRQALDILERTIQEHPKLSEAWEAIIRIYLDQDDFLMAQRYLDRAYKQLHRLSPVFRLLKTQLDSMK